MTLSVKLSQEGGRNDLEHVSEDFGSACKQGLSTHSFSRRSLEKREEHTSVVCKELWNLTHFPSVVQK